MPDSSNPIPSHTAEIPNFVVDQSLAKTDPNKAKKMVRGPVMNHRINASCCSRRTRNVNNTIQLQVGLEAKIMALETQIEDTKAKLKDSTAKLECVTSNLVYAIHSWLDFYGRHHCV